MPASNTPTSNQPDHDYVFRLPRSALRIASIAFGIGLLLFAVVWWMGRDKAFYKVEPTAPGKPLSELEALPEPLAGGAGASDMPDAAGKDNAPQERPQLVETAPPAPAMPAPIDESTQPAMPIADAPVAPASVALAPGEQPVPIEGQMPPPRYPAAALRRGESGTVLVRVEVDTAGMPAGVALVQRSGSRDLDRAAMEAVRGWRFQPAQRNGQAISASLVIPIDFKADR
ncbi:energy transducer TonB [Pseudoxanthomonas yeongjuensis]|jgi:protein TonB|uniref:energy transducer TonB n=1 Tax=Pseudoxanthomonas yeongjuensis TaxID=377616 RepID=UPI0013920FB7|nr:energy transducer TonB [Pseudoxanthomonas yeongjuensis]KAF1717978.1 energy transducer TonB [Pseudoxanthomonas yeongjuensis]